METFKYFCLAVAMIAVFTGIIVLIFNARSECHASGGALVKGAIGYECVAGPR